ncbi:GtrA family protein [[Pseudomonas] carboxydohydrogena]|uniref:GtrA family protein n=1 Tax=Afipia carboxydohydrogena TaxID=290 RepID=A0ABY8BNK3_AFICR|nr:GtrA family protein [[Pseudomonas] carboxydohydrogena]WEF51550.1 GtrA family protein [[Pseudomonas] carboxydohydrogena]
MRKNDELGCHPGDTVRYQFARFILVGAIAAAANIGSRVFFSQFISFKYAIVLAYFVGMTMAFSLSRHFVFEGSDSRIEGQIARFGIVNLVALVQIWIISIGLADYVFPLIGFTWRPEFVAHTIGVLSPVVTSYLGHKHFTFRKSFGRNA